MGNTREGEGLSRDEQEKFRLRRPAFYIEKLRVFFRRILTNWPTSTRLVFAMSVAGVALAIGSNAHPERRPLLMSTLPVVGAICALVWVCLAIDSFVLPRLQWLTRMIQWHTQYLKHLEGLTGGPSEVRPTSTMENSWPWGSYHTDMLAHLDAAAQ